MKLLALPFTLPLLLGLAACSPQPAAAPAAQPAPPTAATGAQPASKPTPTPVERSGDSKEVILATTTSTQDSGLLDVLVPLFEQQSGYRVKTISVGTGAALALGARGEADVVLVHAPEAEEKWMAEGNGTERLLVMHNDFLLLGPPADPAGIKGERSALVALKRIAERGAPWVSRDDNSGTDQLEKRLWQQAGLSPKGQSWYISTGQGMGATLTLADQKNAYTLSDRATYLARQRTLQAVPLVEGDAQLLNVYHVMPVNPARFPNVRINAPGGKAFADFLVAPRTQEVIGVFGKDKYGQALFFPDAGKAEDQLGQ
ncbi:MAG: substrate-binding domain-containing protein [Chloroflexi bacterium]|nr:substrate-binding domain-containing protein [Chloroflexota bacterium]